MKPKTQTAINLGDSEPGSIPERIATRRIGSDELNLAEFPLAGTGREKSETGSSLFFKDRIFDEGAKAYVDRELIVTASEHFGLPTPADSDILIVLMYLTNQRSGFKDRTLRFSRYEIVKLLSWPTSGASYSRIDESLQRWVSVTLHYKRSWWSRKDSNWQNKAFHILEAIDLVGRSSQSGDVQSSITWNSVMMESVASNHVKRLDLETYFALNSPSARQAYRFLDKRFFKSKNLVFDLRSFACEHVGLSRSYDNGKLKDKLKPCLSELEGVGFLRPMPKNERYVKVRAGEWKIKLSRAVAADETVVIEQPASLDESNLKEELTSRGVSELGAKELATLYSHQKITETIRYVDWLSRQPKNAPKNIAAFLVAAIRDEYKVPASFRKAPAAQAASSPRKAIKTRAQETVDSADLEVLAKTKEYFESLPTDEAIAFEYAAIASGNRFVVQTYERLKENNDSLFEEIRWNLLRSYFTKVAKTT